MNLYPKCTVAALFSFVWKLYVNWTHRRNKNGTVVFPSNGLVFRLKRSFGELKDEIRRRNNTRNHQWRQQNYVYVDYDSKGRRNISISPPHQKTLYTYILWMCKSRSSCDGAVFCVYNQALALFIVCVCVCHFVSFILLPYVCRFSSMYTGQYNAKSPSRETAMIGRTDATIGAEDRLISAIRIGRLLTECLIERFGILLTLKQRLTSELLQL